MIDQWAGLLWQRFKDLYGQKWLSLFQGDEAIELWRVTWASGLDVTAEQIKFALARLGTDYPEWPPTFGQFKVLCDMAPKPRLELPPPEPYVAPTAAHKADFSHIAKTIGKSVTPWWIPERVVNYDQVNFIVLQANRFGANSQAGRLLQDCKAYGCITADNQLGTPPDTAPHQ